MKILIDILHPAHVHVFRNFIKLMEKKGHTIIVTARKKDVALKLLDYYQIKHTVISEISKNKWLLFNELASRTFKLYQLVKTEKPDILMGCMGPSISLVGKLRKIPTIVFYNNESAKMVNFMVYRLATRYITSSSYEEQVAEKHITHTSYHELAYLHPNRFIPDKKVLEEARICPPFIIVRLVSLSSSHDFGVEGLTNKLDMCKLLEKYGRVVITSEKELPGEFEKYRLNIRPEKLHDLLAQAQMLVGESATLAAEAALLGVPAVYIATSFRGYTNELEKEYGLVYNFKEQPEAEKKIKELLELPNLKQAWQEKREKMLRDKIDLTAWMVHFVEDFGKNQIKKEGKSV